MKQIRGGWPFTIISTSIVYAFRILTTRGGAWLIEFPSEKVIVKYIRYARPDPRSADQKHASWLLVT